MRIINPKPISEIREEKDLLAQKEAMVFQLKQENERLRSDNLMVMEAVAEVYEQLLVFQEQVNGGTS